MVFSRTNSTGRYRRVQTLIICIIVLMSLLLCIYFLFPSGTKYDVKQACDFFENIQSETSRSSSSLFNIHKSDLGGDCGPQGESVKVDVGFNMCVHLQSTGDIISNEIRQKKEPYCNVGKFEQIEKLIRNKQSLTDQNKPLVTLDVGANIGSCSLYFASLGHKVYAFEPVTHNLKQFYHSITLNKFEPNIKVFPMGAGEKESYSRFFINKINKGNNVISGKTDLIIEGEDFEESIIHIISVSENVKEHIHIAKVDVEGHELSVGKGSIGLIKNFGIDVLYQEFSPKIMRINDVDPLELLVLYHEMGYFIFKNRQKVKITNPSHALNSFGESVDKNIKSFNEFVDGRGDRFTDLIFIHKKMYE